MSNDVNAKDDNISQIVKVEHKKNDSAFDVIDAAVVADIPVELSSNLTLLARKLTSYLSYYSAASLTRLNTLNKFISAAEDRLYNVNVDKLDIKELNARYKEAKKAQAEIMTICGQVSKQAVDTDNTARMDEVYNLLRGLSNQTLLELKNALTDTEDDNTSE